MEIYVLITQFPVQVLAMVFGLRNQPIKDELMHHESISQI